MKAPLLFVLLALCLSYSTQVKFSVEDRYIMKDGEPFTVLGMNYAPTPIGADATLPNADRGDFFSTDWGFIYKRDIETMREMGINTIRVYSVQPEKSAKQNNHEEFLDLLWNDGEDPIYVWLSYPMSSTFNYISSETKPHNCAWRDLETGDWHVIDTEMESINEDLRVEIQESFTKLATRYGGHNAVIGFVIGNENNDEVTRFNKNYWKFLDETAAKVKAIAEDKLTMASIVDDSMITVGSAESTKCLKHLDVWGINSYRGKYNEGFDSLFTEYAAISNRPLIISEYGPPASTRNDDGEVIILPDNAQKQSDYIESHFDDIVEHRHICSGGLVFEFTDEWWKAKLPGEQNPSDVKNPSYPGGWGDEEYFGIFSIEMVEGGEAEDFKTRDADILTPRAAVEMLTLKYTGFDPASVPAQYPLIATQDDEEEGECELCVIDDSGGDDGNGGDDSNDEDDGGQGDDEAPGNASPIHFKLLLSVFLIIQCLALL